MRDIIFVRRAEAAKALGVSYHTILEWVKKGYIKEYRISEESKIPLYDMKEIKKTMERAKYE